MNDPLSDNSRGFGWAQGTSTDGSCTFTAGAYQVTSTKTQAFHYCTSASGTYRNFTFEAQVRIVKGDCGGLIFRADSNPGKLYIFEMCMDGSYNLFVYRNSSGDSSLLANASSSAIKSGLNQANLLAVTAQSSSLVLYVNMQKVTSVNNAAFSQGQVALAADSFNNTTQVVFSNARLWTL